MMNLVRAGAAVLLLLSATACSGGDEKASSAPAPAAAKNGGNGGEKKILDRAGVVAEYRQKVEEYPWPLPRGFAFPKDPPAQDAGSLAETGVGVVYADTYFECAWTAVFLNARAKDKKAADAALQRIDTFYVESEFATKYLEPPGAENFRENVLKKARLGDVSEIKAFFEGNGCAARPGIPKIA